MIEILDQSHKPTACTCITSGLHIATNGEREGMEEEGRKERNKGEEGERMQLLTHQSEMKYMLEKREAHVGRDSVWCTLWCGWLIAACCVVQME